MTSKEYWRQIKEIERRRVLAAQLASAKAAREQEARRTRDARESARLVQHLDPARIYEVQPLVQLPSGFALKPPPRRPQDAAKRVDQILEDLGR